jgi:hypothetical protein
MKRRSGAASRYDPTFWRDDRGRWIDEQRRNRQHE